MKKYFSIVGLVLFFIVWFGFIGPFCVSGSTELAIGFVGVSLISLPFIGKFIGKVFE